MRQTVLLPGTYRYATPYTFRVKPFNTELAAGAYGYPDDALLPNVDLLASRVAELLHAHIHDTD